VGYLASLAQDANRNVLGVNVQADEKHKAPLESKTPELAPSSTLPDRQRLPS
jgi:hypothetical protein